MSEQILITLKQKIDNLTTYNELDIETQRNILKEELQFYVLNFVYHHIEYSKWIMYGGSALRIIHGLDRMSVDLDFEVSHAITKKYLEDLKNQTEEHFKSTYGVKEDFLTIKITAKRGLLLKFHIGEELNLGYPSKQIHIKIDLNHFIAPKTVHERRPIDQSQFSFVIVTYNMSALMASKIAAIFLRGTRGVGEAIYEEKGRDIYDLLWYMNKKVVPDFDYLVAKNIDIKDPRALFTKLTLQMNKVDDDNLKQDLTPLFTNPMYITNWLKNWRESFLQRLDDYKIRTIVELEYIKVDHDLIPGTLYFIYTYNTKEGKSVQVIYAISDYWVEFSNSNLLLKVNEKIKNKIEFTGNGLTSHPASEEILKQYIELFHQKTEEYFKKTHGIMMGDTMTTKLIRMTANNLNQKEQIVLTKLALLSCELDDLLK